LDIAQTNRRLPTPGGLLTTPRNLIIPVNTRSLSTVSQKTKLPENQNNDPQILNQDGEDFEIASKMFATFLSGFCWSASLQIPITLSLHMMLTKMRNKESYSKAAQQLSELKLADLFYNSLTILQRRTLGSVLPASILSSFSVAYGIHPLLSSLIAGSFESLVAASKEPKERFNMIVQRSGHFPHITSNIDLLAIDEESFNELLNKFKGDKDNIKSYQDLEALRRNFKESANIQRSAIFIRNFTFALAVFLVAPAAAEYVKENGDKIFEKTGINKEYQSAILTNIMRTTLALMTTPFDNVLTQASCGDLNISQLKNKPLSAHFTGGVFRTIFCFLSSTTIAKGIENGESVKGTINEIMGKIVDNYKEVSAEYEKKSDKNGKVFAEIIVSDAKCLEFIKKEGGELAANILEAMQLSGKKFYKVLSEYELPKGFALLDSDYKPGSSAMQPSLRPDSRLTKLVNEKTNEQVKS
jgi:hypothetical protein